MSIEIILLLLPLALYMLAGLKAVTMRQRMVVYRLGIPSGSRGPGLTFIWPVIEKEQRFDVSPRTASLPKVLLGNMTESALSGEFTYCIDDVIKAVGKTRDSGTAKAFTRTEVTRHTAEIIKSSPNDIDKRAQEAVRKAIAAVLPGLTVLECATQKKRIENQIREQVNKTTRSFGVTVTELKIHDFRLITSLLRLLTSLTPQLVVAIDDGIERSAVLQDI